MNFIQNVEYLKNRPSMEECYLRFSDVYICALEACLCNSKRKFISASILKLLHPELGCSCVC